MTIGRTFLNGKLLVGYKRTGVESWLYDGAPILAKVSTPDVPTDKFLEFRKQVGLAIREINMNSAGKDLVAAYQNISQVYEVVPSSGGGFFVPACEAARGAGYEFVEGCDGVISWDPTTGFKDFPAWVVLAHELGHAIQLHTSGKSAQGWFTEYGQRQQAIELDNIARHETPIVRSLGLTPRTTYP